MSSGGLTALIRLATKVGPKAAPIVPKLNPDKLLPILIGTKTLADKLNQHSGDGGTVTQPVPDPTVVVFKDSGVELVQLEPWDPEGADKGKPDGGPAVSLPGDGDEPPELRDWMKNHFHYAQPYIPPPDARSDVATTGGSIPGSPPGSPRGGHVNIGGGGGGGGPGGPNGGGDGGGGGGGDPAGNPGAQPGGNPGGLWANLNRMGLNDKLMILDVLFQDHEQHPSMDHGMGPGPEIPPAMIFTTSLRYWRKSIVHSLQELLKVTPTDKEEELRIPINTLIKSLMKDPIQPMVGSRLKSFLRSWKYSGDHILADAQKFNIPLSGTDKQVLATMLVNTHVLFEFLDKNPTDMVPGDSRELSDPN